MDFLERFISISSEQVGIEESLKYFNGRSISLPTLTGARVGYIDRSFPFLEDLFDEHEGCSVEKCDYCRFVLWFYKDGKSRFDGHVVFPLTDFKNRVVGFSLRGLKKKSFESFVVRKENVPVLFKSQIGVRSSYENDSCWIVEGPVDLLSLNEVGILNAIAIMTNNMSRNQIRWMKRLSSNFMLAMDSDEAGTLGANNARIRLGSELCTRIKWSQYSECKDMNDLLNHMGKSKFKQWVLGVIS